MKSANMPFGESPTRLLAKRMAKTESLSGLVLFKHSKIQKSTC